MCMHVYMCVHMSVCTRLSQDTRVEVRGQFVGASLIITWVLRFKFLSSGLVANTITHGAILVCFLRKGIYSVASGS